MTLPETIAERVSSLSEAIQEARREAWRHFPRDLAEESEMRVADPGGEQ